MSQTGGGSLLRIITTCGCFLGVPRFMDVFQAMFVTQTQAPLLQVQVTVWNSSKICWHTSMFACSGQYQSWVNTGWPNHAPELHRKWYSNRSGSSSSSSPESSLQSRVISSSIAIFTHLMRTQTHTALSAPDDIQLNNGQSWIRGCSPSEVANEQPIILWIPIPAQP